jgi:hypothetical protein
LRIIKNSLTLLLQLNKSGSTEAPGTFAESSQATSDESPFS